MSHHNIKGFDVTEPGEIERLKDIHRRCSDLFDRMCAVALNFDDPEFERLATQFREIAGRKG